MLKLNIFRVSFLLNLPLADPINGVIFYAILAIAGIIILLQRKVWPLVIAHFLIDAVAFVGYSFL